MHWLPLWELAFARQGKYFREWYPDAASFMDLIEQIQGFRTGDTDPRNPIMGFVGRAWRAGLITQAEMLGLCLRENAIMGRD